MLHSWIWSTVVTVVLVLPTWILADDAGPLPAPETLPLPAVVTPSVIDDMPSVAMPDSNSLLSPSDASIREGVPIPEMLSQLRDTVVSDPANVIPSSERAKKGPVIRSLGEFWGYRTSEQAVSWTVGDGDQFGSFAMEPDPYLEAGFGKGFELGVGIQFLSGPQRTDMPSRVFDFSIGYQQRATIGDFAYDISAAILAASDFEGSSRDGIRFPAHAVGYFSVTDTLDLVLGVDYVDREDIRILPVGGLLLRPDPDIRMELVFPRPRVDFQLTPGYRLYLNGGLGGGTWAVERDSELDDLASLYQLQFGVGLEWLESDQWAAVELVYLFDRKLEYAFGPGSYDIGSTVMIRVVARK